MKKTEFFSRYKATGKRCSAIFGNRKSAMDAIFATGAPVYCDQSYYAQCDELDIVERDGEHYKCDIYRNFEDWRDCHYYTEYVDADGNTAWLMTGGRYE